MDSIIIKVLSNPVQYWVSGKIFLEVSAYLSLIGCMKLAQGSLTHATQPPMSTTQDEWVNLDTLVNLNKSKLTPPVQSKVCYMIGH